MSNDKVSLAQWQGRVDAKYSGTPGGGTRTRDPGDSAESNGGLQAPGYAMPMHLVGGMVMLMGLDKQDRVHFRLPIGLEVKYRYFADQQVPGGREACGQGKTMNISKSGMLLACEDPPIDLAGDLLSGRVGVALTLELPGGEPVRALAKVVWIEGLGQDGDTLMGLRFQEITSRCRDLITDFLLENYLA